MAQEASTGHWKGQYPWPFGRDPNSSVLRRDVESDRLIGNVSVTYVTLVPWRRERRRHVPSPRLLYHRWAAGSRLGSSAKTWICAAPAAYLCSRCDQRQLDAIIACQCALARLVYTRSGLVSLSDIPIRRSSDVTSPFPPSGNEGYIRNRDVTFIVLTEKNIQFLVLFTAWTNAVHLCIYFFVKCIMVHIKWLKAGEVVPAISSTDALITVNVT